MRWDWSWNPTSTARDRSLATAVSIEDMFRTANDGDNRATVRAVPTADLRAE